ncbi:MAG: nitrilase family protein [Bacteroidales bacterium]|jgi:predicted amidohydrolase|nr:nitrilase family protein [Bacteroidales bacterium]
MSNTLRIHVCQTAPCWENPSSSLDYIENLISGIETDLLILPEFFSTGFSMNPACSESAEGPTFQWMMKTSAAIGGAVAGSLPVIENGHHYNRFYFCKPDGSWEHYDKKHIFTIGEESKTYAPGSEIKIVTWRGWRIRLSTCYDLRFPVWLRNKALEYDLLLNVAAWPSTRIGVTDVLIRARAIENQCYAIFCNRTGNEPTLAYNGGSSVIDFKGESILRPNFGAQMLLATSLELDKLHAFREKFPVWKDQDDFLLR